MKPRIPLLSKNVFYLFLIAGLFFSPVAVKAVTVPTSPDDGGAIYLPLVMNGLPSPTLAGCPVFPSDNIWNTPVDTLPVDGNSGQIINSVGLGAGRHAHADFGSGLWDGGPIGIPFVVVPGSQPFVSIIYTAYGNESDPGPYPVPANAPVEGGSNSKGDRHTLVLDSGNCKLYELYRAFPQSNGSWKADSGAVYSLTSNGPLRHAGWTSADAAGLPIFPGLVRYDEVASGEIRHAIRFTGSTYGDYVWPARHRADGADSSCGSCPKMGQRFRLKASFDISKAPADVQVILRAMKKYGVIMADNGSPWYFSGAPDARWNNDHLHWLDGNLTGSAFEAVNTTTMMIDPNSGQARQP